MGRIEQYRLYPYLVLSLLINLGVMFHLQIKPVEQAPQALSVLEISLSALAARAPVSPPEKMSVVSPEPTPMIENLVAVPTSPTKVVVSKPLENEVPQQVETPRKPPATQPMVKPERVDVVETVPEEESKSDPVEESDKKIETEVEHQALTDGRSQSTVLQEASYRRQVAPAYPRRAVQLGQQGVVLLHAQVTPEGKPAELLVAETSGHRLLDLAALKAVRKWEFEPTNVNGTPVTSWVRVPVNFVLR